jgi:hypothetical protein
MRDSMQNDQIFRSHMGILAAATAKLSSPTISEWQQQSQHED